MTGLIDFSRDYIIFMSVLMLAGGIFGYVKASSKPSLISGVISSLLLGITFIFSLNGKLGESLIASFIIYSVLDLVFLMRLIKTKKFMPGGLILVFCVIGQVLAMGGLRGILESPTYRG